MNSSREGRVQKFSVVVSQYHFFLPRDPLHLCRDFREISRKIPGNFPDTPLHPPPPPDPLTLWDTPHLSIPDLIFSKSQIPSIKSIFFSSPLHVCMYVRMYSAYNLVEVSRSLLCVVNALVSSITFLPVIHAKTFNCLHH